ncbi:MAG: hypothetical protein AB7P03_00405 [Kofleriaceae bacterium]
MRRLTSVVVSILVLLGCREHAPIAPEAVSLQTPALVDTADSLWALAPAGTQLAIVAAPRGVQILERAAIRLDADPAQQRPLRAMLGLLGADVLRGVPSFHSLAEMGLRSDRGFAVFSTSSDQLWILPVADRAKLMAAVGGTSSAEHDTVGRMTCKTINSVYACTSNAALLATIGQGNVRSRIDIVNARGDIEGMIRSTESALNIAFVAQLEPGRLTVEAALPDLVAGGFALAGSATKPRATPTSAGFLVADLGPYLATLPAIPLTADLTLRDLGASIGGPITATLRAATVDPGLHVPLRDPAPANKLVAACTTMFPPTMLAAKQPTNTCRIAPPTLGSELDIWVEGTELRIGDRSATRADAPVQMTASGTALANQPWMLAFWGRGTLFGSSMYNAPGVDRSGLERLLGISELGLGARLDGDVTRVRFVGRTIFDNPEDVVAKLLALRPDERGDASKVKAIADGAPSSPFAADFAAGHGGVILSTGAFGMLASVGIPALMDRLKRVYAVRHRPAFERELDRLVEKTKTAFAASRRFPVGKTPLTPANVCCTYPEHKCPAGGTVWNAPIWKQLGFQIDEPGLFQYSYESDGKVFTARAVTDLDCDGVTIEHTLKGWIANGQVRTTMILAPPNSD